MIPLNLAVQLSGSRFAWSLDRNVRPLIARITAISHFLTPEAQQVTVTLIDFSPGHRRRKSLRPDVDPGDIIDI